ncbi:MBL fold metallo-hydrolase [Metabacillus fastidiosus]|uniref:MBL fold metallo-hydrolase n=1 Tax=Metabacillus fastidiosus TaxID=1458 RepID=UPI002E205175|nr:MBL fold metallo-hydrolase [Metabacillus fastidiosus]
MANIHKIDERLTIIDSMDLRKKNRTSTYILQDGKIALFEPSASPSIPYIIEGLRELNIPLEKIDYIIVTHIHLDHAGGAGLLLEKCPNAKLVVHSKGARHMINPERLIASAKSVYGDDFDRLFDPIVAVPEDRVIIMNDKETLQMSEKCTLTFYNSPGHANHHFSIHDSVTGGIFTGDTVGIFYSQLLEKGLELYLPATSPNQFNPDAMLASAKLFEDLGAKKIYFSHFGVSEHPQKVFTELRKWVPAFIEAGKNGVRKADNNSFESLTEAVVKELDNIIFSYLQEQNIYLDDEITEIIKLDIFVSSQGIVDYFQKNGVIHE